jgi:hypothetical protein
MIGRMIVLLALLGACKGQDEPVAGGGPGPVGKVLDAGVVSDAGPVVAAAPTAEVEAVLGRALAMAHELGEVAAANAKDCGALASAIEALIVENQPLLDEMARHGSDATSAQKIQTWMASHATELDGAIAKARPALEGCRNDPRIKAAFERLSKMP